MSSPDFRADPPGFEDDDIPVIRDDMLHPDVDFEAGMSTIPVVSLVVMAACVAAFIGQVARGGTTDLKTLVHIGALSRQEVAAGELWRLVSATFLHGGPDHLIGNLLMLFVLGIGCEHAFGRAQFLTLYVISGLVGSLFSLMGGRVSVGASGAIFGLAGSIITMLWRHRHRLHLRDRRIGVVLAVWAGYQILLGTLIPQVDNHAHLGGLFAGALLGLILPPAVLHGRSEVAARSMTWAGSILACLALAATAAFFIPRLLH